MLESAYASHEMRGYPAGMCVCVCVYPSHRVLESASASQARGTDRPRSPGRRAASPTRVTAKSHMGRIHVARDLLVDLELTGTHNKTVTASPPHTHKHTSAGKGPHSSSHTFSATHSFEHKFPTHSCLHTLPYFENGPCACVCVCVCHRCRP